MRSYTIALKNNIILDYWIWMVMQLFAILSICCTVVFVDNYKREPLLLLTIAYFFINVVFASNFRNMLDHMSKCIIQVSLFVRIVVLTYLYSMNYTRTLFTGSVDMEYVFMDASLLMTFEYLVVQFVMYLFSNYRLRPTTEINIKSKKIFSIRFIVIFMVIYLVLVSIVLPDVLSSYRSIFRLGDQEFNIMDFDIEYAVGGLNRIIKTLFGVCLQLLRILLPAYLMKYYFDWNKERNCIWALVIGCILQYIIMSYTLAESIVSSLVLILYYVQLYPKKKSSIYKYIFISTIGVVLLYFSVRFLVNTENGLYGMNDGVSFYACQIINAYFTGIDNVAAIFSMPEGYELETLYTGIIGAIPFNSTLIGRYGYKMQYYYNNFFYTYGQIPPTVGQGYYWFGFFLAPIISAIFTYCSMLFHLKANNDNNNIRFVANMYISIIFSLGICMYNFDIAMVIVLSNGFFLYLITKNSEKLL